MNNDSELVNLTRNEFKLILEHAGVKLCKHEVKKSNIRNDKKLYIKSVHSNPVMRWFAIFYFLTLVLSFVFISVSDEDMVISQTSSLIFVATLLFGSYILPLIIGIFFWFGILLKFRDFIDKLSTLISYYISTLIVAVIGAYGYFSAQSTLVENIEKFHLDVFQSYNKIVFIFICFVISVLSVFWFVFILKRLLVIEHKKWMFFNPVKDFCIEILLFAFAVFGFFRGSVYASGAMSFMPLFLNIFIVLGFVIFLIFKNDEKMFDRYNEHFQVIFKYIE